MPRPATGSVVTRPAADGDTIFALRYRAGGARRYKTLGKGSEGWDAERAFAALDETLRHVLTGDPRFEAPTLNELAREVIERSEASDPVELAREVLEKAAEDVVLAELEAMVAQRVRVLIGRRRRDRPIAERGTERYQVPHKGWMRLRDMTRMDVDAVAEAYENAAGELLSYAAELRGLSAEMAREGVERVGDLARMQYLRRVA